MIRGRLVARSTTTFHLIPNDSDTGEVITYEWSELEARTAYETYRRLIPRDDGQAWFELGELMLRCDARGYAERAFAVAARLDPMLTDDIADTLAGLTSEEVATDPEHESAPTTEDAGDPPPFFSPLPASTTPARPWPVLDPEQQAEATEEVRDAAASLLTTAGFTIDPVETEHFLLYSDLPPRETRRWAGELDRMYRRLVRALDVPADIELFHGKCVIFIFAQREDFIHFEALAMNWDASGAAGVFHGKGPHAYVSFYRSDTDARFASTLVHETVHAFMYRYRSPVSLPTWANEGLADYTAGELIRTSGEPLSHWYHVKNFINMRGDVRAIMNQQVADGTWYDDDSYPVSHMLVRFMLRHKPRAFKLWIDDIKDGKAWQASLKTHFNVTADDLAIQFGDFVRSEREYGR
ncbi:MAG: hypothetical protein KDA21_05415 [Phycisphaerales bacterium]|nr:hypothetical protein [Phycisphaerales bacterium]